MSDKETRRSREKAFFEADFTPSADPQRHPSPEERLATAAEYAAYQLEQGGEVAGCQCYRCIER